MIEVNYNDYKRILEENMRLIPENHKLKEENERLNNIIDEAIELIYKDDVYDYRTIVDKLLKILKRGNKNE